MAASDNTPVAYAGATSFVEFKLPTAEAKETDTLIPLVISGGGIDATGQAGLSATNFVFTDVSGNLIPSFLVKFTDGGDLQVRVRFPNVSTVSATYVYLQYGAGITRSNDAAAVTGDSYFWWNALEEASGTIDDMAGNYDSLSESSLTYAQTAQVNKGVSFNGSTGRYDMASMSEINSASTLTISMWVKASSTAPNNILISKADFSSDWSFYINQVATAAIAVGIALAGGDSGSNFLTSANNLVVNGELMKLDFVFNLSDGTPNDRLKIYKNGVEISTSVTGTIRGDFLSTSAPVVVGDFNSGLSWHYAGIIDDVRMASDAKSINHCLRAYNNENGFATDSIFTVSDTTELSSIAVLSGTNSISVTASGNMTGKSSLSGTNSISVTASGDLTGTNSLSGTNSISVTASGNLTTGLEKIVKIRGSSTVDPIVMRSKVL